MKIRVAPPFLNEALAIASTVAPSRTLIPSLNCVKLTAGSGKDGATLTVEATDSEVGIRFQVPLMELGKEGTLVLPAAKFAALVRQVRDPDFEISADHLVGTIKTSDGVFRMVGLEPGDFLTLPQFDPGAGISVPAKELAGMIRKTAFAVSTDSVRFALTGQLVEARDGELRMVASDGKRLSFVRRPLADRTTRPLKVIVPTKTLNLLSRVLLPEDELVTLDTTDNTIRICTRRARISSRVIEGTFPDYEAVTPKNNPQEFTFDRDLLISGLRRASLMASDQVRAVKVSFAPGLLTLFSRSQDVGEARIELRVEYDGQPLEIVFNPDFVLDYLSVVDQERVTLRIRDRSTAGVFSASEDFHYILMPLDIEL